LQRVPRAELHVVENAGHIPNVEQPRTVNPILLAFLNAQ
jgi:pimeloyl-ACP methyl ester carboxylesterase